MTQIATLLNAHSNPDVVLDTLDSIIKHVSKQAIVLIDGCSWDRFKEVEMPVAKMEGFKHGVAKAPYRNVALGLMTLVEAFPDSDWYCYCEEDVLFGSNRFMHNLVFAEQQDVWMLGNDGHVDNAAMPLIQMMLDEEFTSSYYFLGCCQFFHSKFMKKLLEINFFEKFLNLTNGFSEGYFPLFSGYDISESMYPTMCRHFGGNVGVLASYQDGNWHGAYEYFPCRWKPDLDPETEDFPAASIMHPVKKYDHPIRVKHRKLRENERVV